MRKREFDNETRLMYRIFFLSTETSNDANEKVDIFGLSETTEKTENGWLTSDVVVQLRLNSYAIQWQTSSDENKKVI